MNDIRETTVATKLAKASKSAVAIQLSEALESRETDAPGEWKLTVEEFTFSGCHHNCGGTD